MKTPHPSPQDLKGPRGPRFCKRCGKPSGSSMCKDCRKSYDANYYSNNAEAKIQSATRIKRELQQWYFKLKDQKMCQAGRQGCSGGPYAACQLDFDHVPGRGQKVAEISWMVRNGIAREKIEQELQKVILICANCHRLITHERRMGKKGEKV